MTHDTHTRRSIPLGGGVGIGAAIGLLVGLLLSGDLALMVIAGAALGLVAGAVWDLNRSR